MSFVTLDGYQKFRDCIAVGLNGYMDNGSLSNVINGTGTVISRQLIYGELTLTKDTWTNLPETIPNTGNYLCLYISGNVICNDITENNTSSDGVIYFKTPDGETSLVSFNILKANPSFTCNILIHPYTSGTIQVMSTSSVSLTYRFGYYNA